MTIADLATRFEAARAEARLAALDAADPITSVEDAYRVQAELIRRTDHDVRGWKVTALGLADQRKYASSRPVAGPLLGPYVFAAPARVSLSVLVAPLLECEVAFVLGSDLPARGTPYDRAQIEAAVAAVVPVFELADSRVETSAPDLLKLADAMGNGLFIVGRPIPDWRKLDLTNVPITLSHNGDAIGEGSSARILGDPLLAVVALANAQPLPEPGLKAGQIVTTGTCTTPVAVRPGTYAADFGSLGTAEMTVT
jgi:2-keto-4-pentenoate hydratase